MHFDSFCRRGEQRIIRTDQRLGEKLDAHKLNLDRETGLLSLGTSLEGDEEGRREGRKRETRKRIEAEILGLVLAAGEMSRSELLEVATGNTANILATLKEMVDANRLCSFEKDGARFYSMAEIEEEVAA